MSNLHVRFPWVVSFSCALLFLGVALVGTPVGNWVEQTARLPTNSSILIQQLLLVLFSALVVTIFGGWRQSGFYKPLRLNALLLAFPPLAGPIIMLFITGVIVRDPLQILMLIVFTAMVGFAEEALCRGVMLGAFLPRGPMQAAVISSLIFGSMHLINLFYGTSLTIALLTVIYTALIGFGFAAPYLRSGGAIWPLISVHALYDFLGKMGHGWGAQAQPTSSIEIVIRLSIAVLVGVYGFWLLRQKQSRPQPVQSIPGEGQTQAGLYAK